MPSTHVSAPTPSAQETGIWQQILDQLTEQQAYNDMMMPEYAHQLHYKIVEGEPAEVPENLTKQKADLEKQLAQYQHLAGQYIIGAKYKPLAAQTQQALDSINSQIKAHQEKSSQQWVKMSDEEWYNSEKTTESERRNWDIAQETQTRQLKALKGELPLTESLQQQKQKEFEQMKATFGITGDLDTASAQDTIGTQNLSEFKKRWNALEEQERYGQLSSGQSQVIQSQGLASDIANRNIGSLAGIGGQNAGLTSGYYSLLQPMMAYNQAGYQAQAQNQATQQQMWASLLGVGGMLGAAGIARSSKKYKTDIKTKTKKDEDKALKQVLGTRSVEFKYKKGMGLGVKKHIGAIAEEVPKAIANADRTAIKLADKLELVAMAVKSLDRKVQKIGAEA